MNKQKYLNILVCGPFSTGKSTFLNKLFGLVDRQVRFGSIHSKILLINELIRIVDTSRLLDIPYLESSGRLESLTQGRFDIGFFVLSNTNGISQEDIPAFNHFKSYVNQKFVILNKIDHFSHSEVEFQVNHICERLSISRDMIYPVTSINSNDLNTPNEFAKIQNKVKICLNKMSIENKTSDFLNDIESIKFIGGWDVDQAEKPVKFNTRVFISYAREDLILAEKVYKELEIGMFSPWLDSYCLLPGQNWRTEIRKIIEKSTHFIALLSNNSINKRGFVQKELRYAFEILDEFPPHKIFIIPARLDDCQPTHPKLKEINWVDLFPSFEKGMNRILASLIV